MSVPAVDAASNDFHIQMFLVLNLKDGPANDTSKNMS